MRGRNEIFIERCLAVHHIKGDKMVGCNGTKLVPIPLQGRFNNKKFDGFKLEEQSFYIMLFPLKEEERVGNKI